MRFAFLAVWFVAGFVSVKAQQVPDLPDMVIITENGTNVLKWSNAISGIKAFVIQRSMDSVLNFSSIGFLTKAGKGNHEFRDEHPELGKNYYRIQVLFNSDIEWYSNVYKVVLDSATISASRNGALNTGSSNQFTGGSNNHSAYFTFTPSTQVFTNPYTGHINIVLGDALRKRYSIKFFDPDKEEVLYIPRIRNTNVVLDKYNFQAKGTYSFQLFDGQEMIESGHITIY